jgi:tRNA pseudouridine38-40 synthase
MLVAYDGSAFHGFAANLGVATVADTLQGALAQVLQHPVRLTAAGRTDRGVHAWGQVVSFDTERTADLDQLQHAVNGLCGPTIVVRRAEVADADFDARHSATSRLYRYTVLCGPVPDPFLAATAWWIDRPLDLRAMQLGCDPLIGEHDFASFCRRPKEGDDTPTASLMRRVIDARWIEVDDERAGTLLRFEVEATAFCHQMVRSIVGTLDEVGGGKKRAGDVASILRARDRALAGQMAPPHGLCLWEVRY